MESFININNVKFKYEGSDTFILDGINTEIKKGEFTVILGRNGCGKSTLAKHLNAILTSSEGNIFIDGLNSSEEKNVYEIRKKVGLILQNPDNQIVAGVVEEDVAFGPENLCIPADEIRKRVDNALKAVRMYEYKDKAPYKLSGGQKQRVAIAGVLAMKPECIVLDEATSMLDPEGREEVMETILRLNREQNTTIVLITHYMDEAIMADKVIIMDKGKIKTEGKPREIFTDVSILKDSGLALTQSTELLYKLKKRGYNLSLKALNEEECAKEIINFLEGKECLY